MHVAIQALKHLVLWVRDTLSDSCFSCFVNHLTPCCSLCESGYIFDGEYHYYHHAHLTINYAELEFLDKLMGTHHSQDRRFVKKTV